MSTTVPSLNEAVGHLDEALTINRGRSLVSVQYLIDLALDVRVALEETARVLDLDLKPVSPQKKPPPRLPKANPDPPPRAVAVYTPQENA